MRKHTRSLSLLFALLSSSSLAACMEDTSLDSDDLGTDEQEIINGTAVDAQTIRDLGLVDVGSGCSGVLQSNNWILTAGHCVSVADQTSTWVAYDGTSRVSDRVYRFAGYNEPGGPDLAMIHVATPFLVNGSTTGYARPIFVASHASMTNQAIDVYGRGQNTPQGAGFGTWRTARVSVGSATGDMLSYAANASGQTAWRGDSGGPSFANNGAGPALVGITSGASYRCDPASPPGQCVPGTITGSSQVFLFPVAWALTNIMNTPWSTARSVDVFDTTGPELRAAREAEVDANVGSWAQLSRSAAKVCANRGFAAGRYNGHQFNGRYGIACSGPGTTWYDATQAEVNATSWGFQNVDTTQWARAARAAFGVCERKGHVSGYFNGHQVIGSRYGVNCLSGNVRHMDATWAELNATGWRVDDANTVGYAHALRAAHGFCASRGFATGFMNGHQSNGRYGVTCQR
jgi:hypothetical protein